MQAEPNLIGPLGGEFLAEPVGATGKLRRLLVVRP
jgi:hypothetical protein